MQEYERRNSEQMRGLCSVIIPVHNSEKYIASSIESVLRQTYNNIEIIIINDDSTDNTLRIIQHIAKKNGKKIKIFSLQKNMGAAFARNEGIARAMGEYIAFLDSDDLWLPEKIEKQINILNKTESALCFTAYDMIDGNGYFIKHRSVKNQITFTDLLKENNIIFSSVLCYTESISNLRFDSGCFHEDYLFLLQLLQKGIVVYGLNQTLLQYRIHSSGKSFNKKKAALHRWKIYREYLHLNFLQCLYYFTFYAINGVLKYI